MFKYQVQLDEITSRGAQCPPADSSPINGEAWRWVTNPVAIECFDPQAVRNPPRLSKAKQKDDIVEECSCWGLSMHRSQNESIAAFQALEAMLPKIRKLFGGHTAGARLTPDYGSATLAEPNGHFDLHPNNDADFLAVFLYPRAI